MSDLYFITGDGCYIHPHCLTCPLEMCIYDMPSAQVKKLELAMYIMELHNASVSIQDIALKVNRSTRTVYRLIEKGEAMQRQRYEIQKGDKCQDCGGDGAHEKCSECRGSLCKDCGTLSSAGNGVILLCGTCVTPKKRSEGSD